MHDARRGAWLEFRRLRRVITVHAISDVKAALQEIQSATTADKLVAAGFVAYEAAPAFDPALRTHSARGFPLLWFGLFETAAPIQLPAPPTWERRQWRRSIQRQQYFDAVARIKSLIRRGETYQVNDTFRLRTNRCEPWATFLHLAAAQQSPLSAFIDTGRWAIASASPELFFLLDGNRIECRPMKGTAARGLTLVHARQVVLRDLAVTGFTGPLLELEDVTGTGLEGAEPYTTPPPPSSPGKKS